MSGSRHSIAVAAEVTISNWAAPGSTPSDVADVVLPNTVGSYRFLAFHLGFVLNNTRL